MRKTFPLLLGLAAVVALVRAINQRQRTASATQWQARRPGTALITGASAGIGAEFARQLAHQGYDLVLLARREEKLRALAEEIQRNNPVKVEIMSADLSDPVDIERAALRIAEIPDFDLLVNNAGFGTGGKFDRIDIQPEMAMIRLHVEASERLMHAALKQMLPRGQGGIINVSSLAGMIPMPLNATYGATKAYLTFFTESIAMEVQGSGLRLQALCPGFTYSEFHDVARMDRNQIPGFLWMPADRVVAESLKGLREGRTLVIPGRINQLIAAVASNSLVRPLIHLAQPLIQRLRPAQV